MPEQVRKVIISDGDQELLFLLRNAFVSVGFQSGYRLQKRKEVVGNYSE